MVFFGKNAGDVEDWVGWVFTSAFDILDLVVCDVGCLVRVWEEGLV